MNDPTIIDLLAIETSQHEEPIRTLCETIKKQAAIISAGLSFTFKGSDGKDRAQAFASYYQTAEGERMWRVQIRNSDQEWGDVDNVYRSQDEAIKLAIEFSKA